MKGLPGKKWILGALSVALVFAMGCAKKELVKSTGTGPGAAVSAPSPPAGKPGEIVGDAETRSADRAVGPGGETDGDGGHRGDPGETVFL